ncbi:hypothetical protein ED208_11325 [Stagnimonas aquatica]|uniref:Uncharacterized protein n=1 Tax=Stagnimonas aquatica TaxID=2689987 RepID=A0A3N0VAA8_9GAMM|nr:hypothetical protein ED208_11325 [Stagnimonas aquatica]
MDYLGYGGYYGGYGYPQAYGPASARYGSYGLSRSYGGFGDYHFDDGYHLASAYGHGQPGFVSAPYRDFFPIHSGSYGPGAGHYGGFGGLHDDVRLHSGSPRHTSGIRHGGGIGHSRPGHGGSRHH